MDVNGLQITKGSWKYYYNIITITFSQLKRIEASSMQKSFVLNILKLVKEVTLGECGNMKW